MMNDQQIAKIGRAIDALRTRIYNESNHLRATRTTAEVMAAEYDRANEAWLESTRQPNGMRGGAVPTHVTDLGRAASLAAEACTKQATVIHVIEDRIAGLRRVVENGDGRKCPECGLYAVTFSLDAYYDTENCANCSYHRIVRALGD
jgi:hypothetical protein